MLPATEDARASLVKAPGIIAGLMLAEAIQNHRCDGELPVMARDGDRVEPGAVVAEVSASVIALLSGERTALNLMQRASGIATATRRYVDEIAGTRAKIYDTRKTAPGLRALDKYAVLCGRRDHRIGLYDMFLIKNNHVDRAGSITAAVERIRRTKEIAEGDGGSAQRRSSTRRSRPIPTSSSSTT